MFDMRLLQDINIEEVQLRTEYYNAFMNGNIEQAKQIIQNNEQLKFKVINAENLNKIISYILDLESKYYTNVEDVLEKHIEDYQISIDDLIYLKDFDNKFQYEVNNFILYNGELYYCIKRPTIGTLPTNSIYWLYLGLKGEESYPSLGINYKGNWSSSLSYSKYDAVVYQNILYVSKTNNSNKIPSISTDDWSSQMEVQNQGIFVSEIEPPNLVEGNVWIEIL